MKKIFTVLALLAAILAIIFSALPLSNLAIFPALIALLFVIIAFYLSKKSGDIKKIIQFIFLLIIMALMITTYKAIFTETKVASTKVLEATETKLEKEAIEELEGLDIEDIEIEDNNIENISTDK